MKKDDDVVKGREHEWRKENKCDKNKGLDGIYLEILIGRLFYDTSKGI